jgi:hypothetical protein
MIMLQVANQSSLSLPSKTQQFTDNCLVIKSVLHCEIHSYATALKEAKIAVVRIQPLASSSYGKS